MRIGPQALLTTIALLATDAGRGAPGGAQESPRIVKQVDHVMILTRERERLVRLLVDTLQLPMVWGHPGSDYTATTGIALGDINLELVPREDAAAARLTSLALQPRHLPSVCEGLTARGLVLREPDVCVQDPGRRRWTIVSFRHDFEGANYFLIQYLLFDMDARRTRFAATQQDRLGGPLGMRRVREFRLSYRPEHLGSADQAWRRLLGPPSPVRPRFFSLGAGPSIVLETSESNATSLLVEVESLARAAGAARSLRLLQRSFPDSVVLDPRRFGGLHITLVNR